MIPDNVEKIIMTKEDYDRNVEQVIIERNELQNRIDKAIIDLDILQFRLMRELRIGIPIKEISDIQDNLRGEDK